ncbi:sugar transferase [Marinovum sp.]|uniref:sugar transferase n=1 Tax=Marinovum sp. TaxID=2024839 RepID=UPI002B2704B8|nr:sugar transferase [Marinovum sp.]
MTPQKRLLDLLSALFLLIVLSPLILGVAVAILLQDGRPVLYVSERMKSPAEPFRLFKFRTMTNSDRDSGVSGGDKSRRITPIGRVLRAKRLDELPQLFNVLKGDLSFVGPRPPLRMYVERFPALYGKVLQSRPGITGLATLVYHGHEERILANCATSDETDAAYSRRCVPQKARLDIIYARRQSVCFDLRLMFATVFRRISLHQGRPRRG